MGLGQVNELTNQIDHVNQKYVYVVLVVLHLPFCLENKTFSSSFNSIRVPYPRTVLNKLIGPLTHFS